MLKVKILSCFLIIIMLFGYCFGFSASAISLDGIMGESDWRDVEPEVIVTLSGESNCDAYFATVSVLTEDSSNRLFFGFKVKVPELFEDSTAYGVAVKINSDEFVYITPDNITDYDIDKYSYEGVVHAASQTDFSAEIAVGVKYGLFTVDNIEVRVIDAEGEPSNVYVLDVDKIIPEPETTTDFYEPVGMDRVDTTKKTTTEKQTTAKKTTTKKETTKKATTKKSTTQKKTTVVTEAEYDLLTTTKKAKSTTDKTVKTTRSTTVAESIDVVESVQTTSYPYWSDTAHRIPEGEETTILTTRQLKMQKGFSYAAVAALILLALGICVVINLKHDKDNH